MAPRAWPLLLFASVALLLLGVLALFTHPMADDWSYAHQGRTRELGPWLVSEYLNWNGRYSSNLFVGKGPLVLGTDALWLYRTIPVALLGATLLAMRSIAACTVGGSQRAWSLGVVLTIVYFHGMPDIADGLYWYTGAVTYQFGTVLLVFLLARCMACKGGVVNVLLIIATAGCSEVHMILALLVVAAAAAFDLSRRKPISTSTWSTLVTAMVCAGAVVLAPGNSVRAALFEGTHDVLHSAWMSLLQTLRFGATWLFDPALLFCSIIYFPLQRQWRREHPDRVLPSPWFTTMALGAVIFLCAFPAYWGTGILGQHRTMNVAYCFFLLLWFANITAWDRALLSKKWPVLPAVPLSGKVLPFVAGLALLLTGNTGGALLDLLSGRAAHYDHQLAARYALLEQSRADGSEPRLPVIVDPPLVLPLYELRADPHDWVNQCYALYFGLEGKPVHAISKDDHAPSRP
ncbi:MAG: hypothetical protein IPJ76_06845 [Flavobacteriales bacterium]|nr:MAG: hypothetical protein IPJ76_06845 [Flavobacteriales bacterium]